MISSEDSDDMVLRAYELGASDYTPCPFDSRVVRRRVSNTIRLYAKQRRLTSLLSQQYNERVKNSRMLIDIMAGRHGASQRRERQARYEYREADRAAAWLSGPA